MNSSVIKVGNRTYTIACVNDEDFDLLLAQCRVYEENVKSFINYDEQMIVIRERMPVDHRQELILHELIHACIEDSGTEQDEYFVSVLAPRLSQLFSNGLNSLLSEFCT